MTHSLIHLIYSSAALTDFSELELADLLTAARNNNEKLGITGMLLYTERSFFQIIEGNSDAIEQLFQIISEDKRHSSVVTIIKEPIAQRSFAEWSMGLANVSPNELGSMVGLNDFFMQASCFGQLDQGRAKKLLSAFKKGRWRAKISNSNTPSSSEVKPESTMHPATMLKTDITFAYQPIIDINTMSVISFEALLRGPNNESSQDVLKNVEQNALSHFDALCRTTAIEMASKLGLKCNLNLNFMALNVLDAHTTLSATIEAAKLNKMDPSRIVLEINQEQLIGDTVVLGEVIEEFRAVGVKISLDHFGAGRASLNLLEAYRPDMLSLSIDLVKDIQKNGQRQAIVRGLAQTCDDLGIDIIVKYIENVDEYLWFRSEGFNLFQGDFFAKAGVESLPVAVYPVE